MMTMMSLGINGLYEIVVVTGILYRFENCFVQSGRRVDHHESCHDTNIFESPTYSFRLSFNGNNV